MKPSTVLIGACHGGFATEVEGFLATRGVVVQRWLDDTQEGFQKIDSYDPQEGEQVIVCIGNPKGREDVFNRLVARGAKFHGMLFNTSPATAKIGHGCITMPFSVVSAHAEVGDMVHINFHSGVGHHVKVGDFCTLSSFVDLCGHVTVGRRVMFGSGARVLPGVTIGDDCIIGAGAVVVSDVAPGKTIYAPSGRVL